MKRLLSTEEEEEASQPDIFVSILHQSVCAGRDDVTRQLIRLG